MMNNSPGSIGGTVKGLSRDKNEQATLDLHQASELFSEAAQKEKQNAKGWHNRLSRDAFLFSLTGEPIWVYEESEEDLALVAE